MIRSRARDEEGTKGSGGRGPRRLEVGRCYAVVMGPVKSGVKRAEIDIRTSGGAIQSVLLEGCRYRQLC
jgi:hypothetical protein